MLGLGSCQAWVKVSLGWFKMYSRMYSGLVYDLFRFSLRLM